MADTDPRPRNINEAIDWLLSNLEADVLAQVRGYSYDKLILMHHGLGQFIRNRFGLWGQNPDLVGNRHPDDVSQEIIEVLWTRLQARP